ncbi:hypothetical protein GCM10020216_053740 [Nonomuraea helvata]
MSESFPRLSARTRRFTLGVPRGFTISPDGGRVVFLRTKSGTDPVTCLWELDTDTHVERLVVDPRTLHGDDEDLPPEERARRERSREAAGGVVAYTTDKDVTQACFALSGGLYVVELASGQARRLDVPGAVIDPRLSPDGRHVAYVTGGALRVQDLITGEDRALATPESETVTYGLAEFIAAEEMDRMRGYWWAPSSDALLVERADEAPVRVWHIADPANPDRPAADQRYPAAGTPNAVTELFVVGLDGSRVAVPYEEEYLTTAAWDPPRAVDRDPDPRSADDAAVHGRSGDRRDHARARGHRSGLGRHRHRRARAPRRRFAGVGGELRGRQPAGRGRPHGHAAHAAGAGGARRRSRQRAVQRERRPDRDPPVDLGRAFAAARLDPFRGVLGADGGRRRRADRAEPRRRGCVDHGGAA